MTVQKTIGEYHQERHLATYFLEPGIQIHESVASSGFGTVSQPVRIVQVKWYTHLVVTTIIGMGYWDRQQDSGLFSPERRAETAGTDAR